MVLLNRRDFTKGVLALGTTVITGCTDFFKTDFIKLNTEEIINTRENLIEKYKKESKVDLRKHPKREYESYYTKRQDDAYTLFYRVEFADIATLEKIVKEQARDVILSTYPSINQMFITFKDEKQIIDLEELLYNADRLPPQVLVKFTVSMDYGDLVQDYASQFNMVISSKGSEFGAISADSKLPGAEARVRARASMFTKWGAEVDTDVFNMKAILDVLESYGYVRHVYQTTILLSNNVKGGVGGEEKIPVPAWVLAGQNVVKTFDMLDVKSSFEGTGVVYDELVRLAYKAMTGSAKRPEARVDFQIPVHDEVFSEGVYLMIGQPFLVAGKLTNMETGIQRKDALLPWPSSKDFEKQVIRIWYEITPYQVILYDYTSLVRPHFELKTLETKIAPPGGQ